MVKKVSFYIFKGFLLYYEHNRYINLRVIIIFIHHNNQNETKKMLFKKNSRSREKTLIFKMSAKLKIQKSFNFLLEKKIDFSKLSKLSL